MPLFILLAFGGIYAVFNIRFEEKFAVGQSNEEVLEEAKSVLESSNVLERIFFLIKADNADHKAEIYQVADSLQQFFANSPWVQLNRIGVPKRFSRQLIDFTFHNIPLYLDSIDYAKIKLQLNDSTMRKRLEKGYSQLLSPMGFAFPQFYFRDPFGLTFNVLPQFKKLAADTQLILKNGYLTTRNGQTIFGFIQIKNNFLNSGKIAANIAAINALEQALEKKFTNVNILHYGGAEVSVANAKQAKQDMRNTIFWAVILLLLILLVYFRSFYYLLLLFLPLAVGILGALFVIFLINGSVSTIAVATGAIMCGIIINFAIHFLSYYRKTGNLRKTIRQISPLIIATAATDVVAYSALFLLDIPLLHDLALFAGFSMLFSVLAVVLAVPALLKKERTPVKSFIPFDRYRIKIHPIFQWLTVIGVIILAFQSVNVQYRAGLNALSYVPDKLQQAENKLDAVTGFKSKNVYWVEKESTVEAALAENEINIALLDTLAAKNIIERYTSISSVWTNTFNRNKKVKQWQQFWHKNFDKNKKRHFLTIIDSLGMHKKAFYSFFKWIESPKMASTQQAINFFSALSATEFVQQNGKVRIINLVRVRPDKLHEFYAIIPEKELVFDNQIFVQKLTIVLKNNLNKLAVLSLIFVMLVVWTVYNYWEIVLATCVPLFLGWLATLGLFSLIGLKLNVFNIVICSFVFSIGIDYALFIVQEQLFSYRHNGQKVLKFTNAMLMGWLATMLGMGVLIFANHPALYMLGKSAVLSLTTVAITVWVLVPPVMRWVLKPKSEMRRSPVGWHFWLYTFYLYSVGCIMILIAFCTASVFKLFSGKRHHHIYHRFGKIILHCAFLNPIKVNTAFKMEMKKPKIWMAQCESKLDVFVLAMLLPGAKIVVNKSYLNPPVFRFFAKKIGSQIIAISTNSGSREQLENIILSDQHLVFCVDNTNSKTGNFSYLVKKALSTSLKNKQSLQPLVIFGGKQILPDKSYLFHKANLRIECMANVDISRQSETTINQLEKTMQSQLFALKRKYDTAKSVKKYLYPWYRFAFPDIVAVHKKRLKDWSNFNSLDAKLPLECNVLIKDNKVNPNVLLLSYRSQERIFYIKTENEAVQQFYIFLANNGWENIYMTEESNVYQFSLKGDRLYEQ